MVLVGDAFSDTVGLVDHDAFAAPPANAHVPHLVEKVIVPMNNVQLEEELVVYTVPEVAVILKISEKSVYRLIERNILKSCCALRHKRVSKKELERFIHATNGMSQ